MARQIIKLEPQGEVIVEFSPEGTLPTPEDALLKKARHLLYYLSIDCSVNVFSTAKQEAYLAASRVLADKAPQVFDDQRPYVNSVEFKEDDEYRIDLALKFICPDGFKYGEDLRGRAGWFQPSEVYKELPVKDDATT